MQSLIIITYQEKLGNYNELTFYKEKYEIITYQEKLGNYNADTISMLIKCIITYQEKLGNYNCVLNPFQNVLIITYQEKLGNYNNVANSKSSAQNYNIPRKIRELQPDHRNTSIDRIITYQEKLK